MTTPANGALRRARGARRPPEGGYSPGALAWRRFTRSRTGVLGAVILVLLYLTALFSQFLAPYDITTQHREVHQPPQPIR
ncbi:MAG: hypothetical protein R6W77_14530, partial [Trueperaceae bacterium]